jgi:hypothetical protein
MERGRRQKRLEDAIRRLCVADDVEAFSNHSYEKAKHYLTVEVEAKWKELVEAK